MNAPGSAEIPEGNIKGYDDNRKKQAARNALEGKRLELG
jgi:hypothetical protein